MATTYSFNIRDDLGNVMLEAMMAFLTSKGGLNITILAAGDNVATAKVLATIPLPTPMGEVANKTFTSEGSWAVVDAVAEGKADLFRINAGGTSYISGPIAATGNPGAMTLSKVDLVVGDKVQVVAFEIGLP